MSNIVSHEAKNFLGGAKTPAALVTGLLLTYGFDETSLISNIKRKKPLMNEDKNECIEANEAKITSKSSYQTSVAVIKKNMYFML